MHACTPAVQRMKNGSAAHGTTGTDGGLGPSRPRRWGPAELSMQFPGFVRTRRPILRIIL
jgi:hypothetical protein